MKTLNEIYNNSCKPGNQTYTEITDKITLIDNFFDDFNAARNFLINREKWKCVSGYSGDSRKGYEIVFPNWIGKSLMEKYVLDNKILDDLNSYETNCNFFYSNLLDSLSFSNYYPHIDSVYNNNILLYVCLININEVPLSTKFYTFNDKKYISDETQIEWSNYTSNIRKEFFSKYTNKKATDKNLEIFLQDQDRIGELKIKFEKEVIYNSNQAIVYPTCLLHSPNIEEKFTKDNPRISLRISFQAKLKKNNTLEYS